MSTGADCHFNETSPRQWSYRLQRHPYGDSEDYDTFGPFDMFETARNHLDREHSNPGGYSVTALPGCPHDLLKEYKAFQAGEPSTYECRRCGDHVTPAPLTPGA